MGELQGRTDIVESIFKDYDVNMSGELSAEQLQNIHQDIRLGGISLPQVQESIKYVCIGDRCELSELFDLLKEMDRRYFLIQDFRWEFSMLDRDNTDTITEDQAKWFLQTVHGEFFSKRKWEKFMRQRAVPGSGVSFAEIEVTLCNIPSKTDLKEEEEEERREREERSKREKEMNKMFESEKERRKRQRDEERKRQEEEEKRRKLEIERRIREDAEDRLLREREKEEAERRKRQLEEEEERGKYEADERERQEKERKEREEEERIKRRHSEKEEARRLRELEEKRRQEEDERRRRELEEAENYERLLKEAHENEKKYQEEADNNNKRSKNAKDEKLKQEYEDAEKRARLKNREWKNKRIRYALKVAIKKRDRERLPPAVKDFKDAKLPDDDMDLQKAEKILKEFMAKDGLFEAMANPHREGLDRHIDNLEKAINFIKRNGFEYMLTHELIEANKLLLQLKKRYKIYAEIMALDQPTVAEIKSYSKPPVLVHQVMTGVFVMLGHKEKEMKNWQNVRIWVGKTGKEGLKRRCLEYLKEPEKKVVPSDAAKTRALLQDIDLDDVRDTSAGAATFFVWAWTMVEETDVRLQRAKEDAELQEKENQKKKAEKEAADAKKKEEGTDGQENPEENSNPPTNSSKPDTPGKAENTNSNPAPDSSKADASNTTEKEESKGAETKSEGNDKNEGGESQEASSGEAKGNENPSHRIGKESHEKFTLSKTGKVKKSKAT